MSAGLPLHRWSPPHAMTHADLVCDLGERFMLRGRKVEMDANQRAVLEDVCAEESPGIPTCFSVAMVGPRQTIGKTTTLGLAAVSDLVLFDAELHLWTAHRASAATAAFRLMRAMIKSDPDTKALFRWPPKEGKGQEELETLDGRRITFSSRQTGTGRSETAAKITVDEALFAGANDIGAILPTLVTVPDAQVRYASSGGLATSEFLRDLRDIGRAGGDPRRAWHEFGAPRKACAQKGCDHRDLDDPGCALNDRALWMLASPTDRATEQDIADQRKELPPDEFMREFLTWWEEPLVARRLLNPVRWVLARVPHDAPASRISGTVALAVEVSPDGRTSAIGLVGRRADGRLQGELIAYGPGTAWVPDFLAGVVERRKPCVTMLDEGGPAAMLLTSVKDAGVETTSVTLREFARASAEMKADLEDVPDGEDPATFPATFVHTGGKVLDEAAASVGKRQLRDVWVFDRESEKSDPIPVPALALARYGLLTYGNLDVPLVLPTSTTTATRDDVLSMKW